MLLKKLAYSLGAALGLVLAANAASAADYKWVFQASENAGEPGFIVKQDWGKNVAAITGGRITIEVVPVGAIVPHTETLDAVGSGLIQGHLTDPSYFSGRDPAFSMLGNLVGAWGNPLEFLEYMKYGGGEQLYNELVHPYGVHQIAAAATGLEAFVSKKPLRTVEDMKGLKVRAPEGMVFDIFRKAGASPVSLPGSEVYTALDKGVIDAADYTVFATNHSQGYHKFAHFPSYPGFHSLPMVDVSINKEIWDALPADLKALMRTATDQLAYDLVFRLRALDLAAVADAKKDPNIQIIDMPAEERKKFRNIAKEEWANWAKRNAMCGRIYESVSAFLVSRNLM